MASNEIYMIGNELSMHRIEKSFHVKPIEFSKKKTMLKETRSVTMKFFSF